MKPLFVLLVLIGTFSGRLVFSQEEESTPSVSAPSADEDDEERPKGGPNMLRKKPDGVHWGGIPIANYSTDQGFEFGILGQRFDYGQNLSRKEPFKNLTTLQFSHATQGATAVLAGFEMTQIGKDDLRWFVLFSGERNPYSPYFGVGDSTVVDDDLDAQGFYSHLERSYLLRSTIRKELQNDWDLSVGIEGKFIDAEPNKLSSQFGNDFGPSGYESKGVNLYSGLIWEKRDSEFFPTRGHYVASFVTFGPSFLSTERSWLRWDSNVRYYKPIIKRRWLTAAGQLQYSVSTDSTPVYSKVLLGSRGTVRGYRFGRFLSNHYLGFRAELRSILIRWSIFSMPLKIGVAQFLDVGKVGDNFSRLFETKTRLGYGIAFIGSYFTDDFLGRADLAFSDEGYSLYLNLGHVF